MADPGKKGHVLSDRTKILGLHWRTKGVALSPFSFIFMQFSAKILPNNSFLSPLRLGNPGSATGLFRGDGSGGSNF